MLSRLASAIFIVLLSSAGAATTPHPVAFSRLVAHPQRYNGSRVSITTYFLVDSAHKIGYLAPRADAEGKNLPEIFVDCPRWLRESQIYAADKHRVRIIGRFDYRSFSRRQHSSADNARLFGWGEIFEMQITKISEFTVVK
jgi:hypothetical protein